MPSPFFSVIKKIKKNKRILRRPEGILFTVGRLSILSALILHSIRAHYKKLFGNIIAFMIQLLEAMIYFLKL